MKNKFFIIILGVFGAACAPAVNMEVLIKQNQKGSSPKFPVDSVRAFGALQESAQSGDFAAQKKLQTMLASRIQVVYASLVKSGGLLFSVRRPIKGYDDTLNNYAVNLESFFEETTGQVRVRKHDFVVTATNGTVLQISYPEYKSADTSVEVSKDGKTCWVALSELNAPDRKFVENALADEVFKSSGEFEISSVDSRNAEASRGNKDQTSRIHEETGEKIEGAYTVTAVQGISRSIILENKGRFPLENLVVEYQSFAEQIVMKLPKDFPSNFRCVGFFEIESLKPGEKKELPLKLPEIVEAKQQNIQAAEYEYYRVIPSDLNQQSEGRMNGVWVKVRRLTPYGERLTREYKSAGVPDVEWANVAPVSVDIR
jgi:hypothetical protein